ncbi:Hermansky-Pudlak syndrome 4 protein isoform X2 [Silurus meridionalis]|uniref:Hermansky-Pudlak syndrome 4 protein isoform X2 n=1 Tax=Silurus meridionalis TaxID=175797 RepID=UPI001EEC3A04|nr:Hermansky-Pudlak syndrome 4 protein isoform X2 [Silurus meridionalis]
MSTTFLNHSAVMAETQHIESSCCSCFFLYDRSKVQEEGDLTRAGICYYYPEHTPLDQQELVCGQLAGVSRCVSEISASPVRLLRLRRSKYAIRMRDDFLWALSCISDLPDVSLCAFLDQLIDLFCFYNGSVRRTYQLHTQEEMAVRWARYLSHLQGGATELHHIFTCLTPTDCTHIDPLLLLKAALILQACQRCPLVLAGCILHRGRMVSTQMSPELTMKVMVHEAETYRLQEQKKQSSRRSSFVSTAHSSTTTTPVFLTPSELHMLRRPLVGNSVSCRSESPERPVKPRLLSRTLSDTPITDPSSSQMLASSPDSSLSDDASFSLCPSLASTPFRASIASQPGEEDATESHDRSMAGEMLLFEGLAPPGGKGENSKQGDDLSAGSEDENLQALRDTRERKGEGAGLEDYIIAKRSIREECVKVCEQSDVVLEPMLLYEHRVRGLVLLLLVEHDFDAHPNAKQEVHSSLASLNGLEAHLRTIPPATETPTAPYTFAHYDRIQNTLTTNMYGRATGAQERLFVKATALLHSHFSNEDMLQEAIIRSASCALYATRTAAQETFFVQQGAPTRNSGIPHSQDSAFSLPSKARHRLLKHGVKLL